MTSATYSPRGIHAMSRRLALVKYVPESAEPFEPFHCFRTQFGNCISSPLAAANGHRIDKWAPLGYVQ